MIAPNRPASVMYRRFNTVKADTMVNAFRSFTDRNGLLTMNNARRAADFYAGQGQRDLSTAFTNIWRGLNNGDVNVDKNGDRTLGMGELNALMNRRGNGNLTYADFAAQDLIVAGPPQQPPQPQPPVADPPPQPQPPVAEPPPQPQPPVSDPPTTPPQQPPASPILIEQVNVNDIFTFKKLADVNRDGKLSEEEFDNAAKNIDNRQPNMDVINYGRNDVDVMNFLRQNKDRLFVPSYRMVGSPLELRDAASLKRLAAQDGNITQLTDFEVRHEGEFF